MVKEDFTKDLEDVEEIEEKNEEESADEDLENILDESEKTTDETINIRTDYLNRFLANPWKTVALENTGITPIINLEEELPEETKTQDEEDKDKDNIEYELFLNEETGEKYVNLTTETEMYQDKLSEGERELDRQRKMYDSPKRVRKEINREKDNIKYVKVEDTIRTDYLVKKKFDE